MNISSLFNRSIPVRQDRLAELVELVKKKNIKKIVSLLESKKLSSSLAIPYTSEAIKKELNAIYQYVDSNSCSDNELAALIAVALLHSPISQINKQLESSGFIPVQEDKYIYIGTYVNTLKSLVEFSESNIIKYEISTANDQRTCPACTKHHGKKYSVKSASIGKNAPPFCDKCRCCIIAVF